MGALGDPYVTLTEFKNYTSVPGANNKLDDVMESAIQASSESIELHCDRQFNRAEDVSSRVYTLKTNMSLRVDDFWTTDGLVVEVDTRGDGTFPTMLASTDFQLHPINGIVAGQPGWPFDRIKFRNRYWSSHCMVDVRVTAKWGWATVPDNVKQATYLMANEAFAAKGAPLGVAGSNAFGDIRVREGTLWERKIRKYVRTELLVG